MGKKMDNVFSFVGGFVKIIKKNGLFEEEGGKI